jgi:hypothetical protein
MRAASSAGSPTCRLACTPGWRRGHRRDAQHLGPRNAQRREPRLGAAQQGEQLAAHRVQLAPRGGEGEAAALRLEQRRVERLRELLQLDRDGGLREVQLLGGARDAAQARDRLEHDELREHAVPEEPAQGGTGHRLLLRRVLRSGRATRRGRPEVSLAALRCPCDRGRIPD